MVVLLLLKIFSFFSHHHNHPHRTRSHRSLVVSFCKPSANWFSKLIPLTKAHNRPPFNTAKLGRSTSRRDSQIESDIYDLLGQPDRTFTPDVTVRLSETFFSTPNVTETIKPLTVHNRSKSHRTPASASKKASSKRPQSLYGKSVAEKIMGFFSGTGGCVPSTSRRHSTGGMPSTSRGTSSGERASGSSSRKKHGVKIAGPYPTDRSDIDSMHGGLRRTEREANYFESRNGSHAYGHVQDAGKHNKRSSKAPPSSYKPAAKQSPYHAATDRTRQSSSRSGGGSSISFFGAIFGSTSNTSVPTSTKHSRRQSVDSDLSFMSPGARPERAAASGRAAFEESQRNKSKRHSTSGMPTAPAASASFNLSSGWATTNHVSSRTTGHAPIETGGNCKKCGRRTRRLVRGRCEACALGPNYTNSVRAPTPPNPSSRYSGGKYGVSDPDARRKSNVPKMADRQMRENTQNNTTSTRRRSSGILESFMGRSEPEPAPKPKTTRTRSRSHARPSTSSSQKQEKKTSASRHRRRNSTSSEDESEFGNIDMVYTPDAKQQPVRTTYATTTARTDSGYGRYSEFDTSPYTPIYKTATRDVVYTADTAPATDACGRSYAVHQERMTRSKSDRKGKKPAYQTRPPSSSSAPRPGTSSSSSKPKTKTSTTTTTAPAAAAAAGPQARYSTSSSVYSTYPSYTTTASYYCTAPPSTVPSTTYSSSGRTRRGSTSTYSTTPTTAYTTTASAAAAPSAYRTRTGVAVGGPPGSYRAPAVGEYRTARPLSGTRGAW